MVSVDIDGEARDVIDDNQEKSLETVQTTRTAQWSSSSLSRLTKSRFEDFPVLQSPGLKIFLSYKVQVGRFSCLTKSRFEDFPVLQSPG